jgi:hypothetical protein
VAAETGVGEDRQHLAAEINAGRAQRERQQKQRREGREAAGGEHAKILSRPVGKESFKCDGEPRTSPRRPASGSRFVRSWSKPSPSTSVPAAIRSAFGADLAADVRAEVARLAAAGRKVAVLTDNRFAQAQGGALRSMFGETPVLVVEPGEGSKSIAGLGRVLDFLAEHRLDRGGALLPWAAA